MNRSTSGRRLVYAALPLAIAGLAAAGCTTQPSKPAAHSTSHKSGPTVLKLGQTWHTKIADVTATVKPALSKQNGIGDTSGGTPYSRVVLHVKNKTDHALVRGAIMDTLLIDGQTMDVTSVNVDWAEADILPGESGDWVEGLGAPTKPGKIRLDVTASTVGRHVLSSGSNVAKAYFKGDYKPIAPQHSHAASTYEPPIEVPASPETIEVPAPTYEPMPTLPDPGPMPTVEVPPPPLPPELPTEIPEYPEPPAPPAMPAAPAVG